MKFHARSRKHITKNSPSTYDSIINKKLEKQNMFLPLKSQMNTHDTHIKDSCISAKNIPNRLQICKIYMRLEMTKTSFCLTQAKNVTFNPCLCVVCVSHPKRTTINLQKEEKVSLA
jgi:hypothetical protein